LILITTNQLHGAESFLRR